MVVVIYVNQSLHSPIYSDRRAVGTTEAVSLGAVRDTVTPGRSAGAFRRGVPAFLYDTQLVVLHNRFTTECPQMNLQVTSLKYRSPKNKSSFYNNGWGSCSGTLGHIAGESGEDLACTRKTG